MDKDKEKEKKNKKNAFSSRQQVVLCRVLEWTCMSRTGCIAYIIRGSLVRKLPNTDDCQWLAVSPSWQPYHHLNHHVNRIILSITSSSSIVRKCERSGTREFTAENTLGRKTLCFSGKVAVRRHRWRVSVSAVARLDPASDRQNVHETVARARFNINIVKN